MNNEEYYEELEEKITVEQINKHGELLNSLRNTKGKPTPRDGGRCCLARKPCAHRKLKEAQAKRFEQDWKEFVLALQSLKEQAVMLEENMAKLEQMHTHRRQMIEELEQLIKRIERDRK